MYKNEKIHKALKTWAENTIKCFLIDFTGCYTFSHKCVKTQTKKNIVHPLAWISVFTISVCPSGEQTELQKKKIHKAMNALSFHEVNREGQNSVCKKFPFF